MDDPALVRWERLQCRPSHAIGRAPASSASGGLSPASGGSPGLGAPDSGVPEVPHREVIVKPFRFFYRVEKRTAWIVAVWHGARLPDEP
jgi:hypothetical protein